MEFWIGTTGKDGWQIVTVGRFNLQCGLYSSVIAGRKPVVVGFGVGEDRGSFGLKLGV